ncbi:MAG: HPr family phosphocarrier protein [Candidatus Delongbacteria bacterium]|nr:HPr family phosphocarrier protein [Candidatus Delongbacteria bacterium]
MGKKKQLATCKVSILNRLGLHARPANQLVRMAARFDAELTLIRDDLRVNGKSIMGVLMLQAEQGAELMLEAEGIDAERLLEAVVQLVADRFNEEQPGEVT